MIYRKSHKTVELSGGSSLSLKQVQVVKRRLKKEYR